MNKNFFQRNWYFLTPAFIVLIPALMVAYFSVSYGYSLSESWQSVYHFGSTGTRQSFNFSERKFKMVHVGMDPRSVNNIIGIAMERNVPEDTHWRFTLPASGAKYYHERTLVFQRDKNGIPRVKERISRFRTL